jgi:hypothetical protein
MRTDEMTGLGIQGQPASGKEIPEKCVKIKIEEA